VTRPSREATPDSHCNIRQPRQPTVFRQKGRPRSRAGGGARHAVARACGQHKHAHHARRARRGGPAPFLLRRAQPPKPRSRAATGSAPPFWLPAPSSRPTGPPGFQHPAGTAAAQSCAGGRMGSAAPQDAARAPRPDGNTALTKGPPSAFTGRASQPSGGPLGHRKRATVAGLAARRLGGPSAPTSPAPAGAHPAAPPRSRPCGRMPPPLAALHTAQ
jgi:hypothetical protein